MFVLLRVCTIEQKVRVSGHSMLPAGVNDDNTRHEAVETARDELSTANHMHSTYRLRRQTSPPFKRASLLRSPGVNLVARRSVAALRPAGTACIQHHEKSSEPRI